MFVGQITPWTLVAVLLTIPVVGLIAYSLFTQGKRGWGWVCVGLFIILILAAISLITRIVRDLPFSNSEGGSWRSGGLGGFGGGFSGGGGATGSW